MIAIYEKGQTNGDKYCPESSFLEMYKLSGKEKRPFVLVLPGGGYNHLATHEGVDVAEWLNSLGIEAGVLYYQLKPVNIDLLLEQINDFIDSSKQAEMYSQIGIIGFSAGGHLAALASTKNPSKPDFSILSYPVISMVEPYLHAGSRAQILPTVNEEKAATYSADQLVSVATPKTFLWHTAEDAAVPVENVLLYAKQLSTYKVPYDLHIFQTGRHGLGLSSEEPYTKEWTKLLAKWLKKNEVIK